MIQYNRPRYKEEIRTPIQPTSLHKNTKYNINKCSCCIDYKWVGRQPIFCFFQKITCTLNKKILKKKPKKKP